MSINNISSTSFPNTLSGLDSINVSNITINGFDVTTLFVPFINAPSNVDLNNKNLSSVNNVGTTTVVASGLIQGGALTTTGLTTTNALKVNSVPAGTTSKYLATDSTGNVIEANITTTYVPYTGATSHVNLNAKNLSNVLTYSGTNVQVTSTETTTLLATGLAQLGTLRISSVPAGTQTNLLAVNATGDVIIGTAPPSSQLNLSPTTAPTLYYFPFITSSSAGVQTVYTDNAVITLTYDTATKTLSPYRLKIQNVPAGTQTSLLAIDSAGNVIQGTSTPPTQLLTTRTATSTIYYPTFVSTNTTGDKSYFVPYPSSAGYNITYTTGAGVGSIGTLNIPQLVIDVSCVLSASATSFNGVPTAGSVVYGLGVDASNVIKSYNVGAPNVISTSTNTQYFPVFVNSLGTGVKDLYQDTVANDFNYNPSTNLLTVGNLAVNGTIGGPNTMTLQQGGTTLMTLSTTNIQPQLPFISAYTGMGAVPAVAADGNGGTGGRILLKASTAALFPVGFGIDSGDEMWISNRGAGFIFYNNGVRSVEFTNTGGLILGSGQPLGGLRINTQASTQSIRMGWTNLASMTNSGFYNIGIGYLQGPLITSGYDNIMIGRESFPNLTTGNNNIGLGFGNGTQITTGYYNIYIGAGASGSIGGTANTNEVVIGANTVGNGTNTITLGGTDTTGFYLSAYADCFYRASRTDHGIKLGSMFDFASAGGWDNSNALFVSTGGMGGNNYGIGMGYNSVAGVGQLVCLAPNVAWQPIRYKASSHVFQAGGNSTIMTVSTTRVKVDDVEIAVRSQTAGQIRMIWSDTGYGAFFRNDNGNLYILLTANNDPYGGWNGLRPFYINLASGMLYSNDGQTFSGGTDTTRITFQNGLGLTTSSGATYGNVSLYGTGINGWTGYDLGKRWTLMYSGNECGFHDNQSTWQWRVINNTYYLTCPTIYFQQVPQQSNQYYQVLTGSNSSRLEWGVMYSSYYNNSGINWGGGVVVANFYKASTVTLIRVSGSASYYLNYGGYRYIEVRAYNTSTGGTSYVYIYQFTNNINNHVSFPFVAQFDGLAVGNYQIILTTNGITDGNDSLYILNELCAG